MSSGQPRRIRKNRRTTLSIAAIVATGLTGGGIASGQGGISAPEEPKPRDVRCLERCLETRVVTETGIAEISGKNLSAVKKVKLRSEDGRINVKPARVRNKQVKLQVPRGAASGKPVVVDEFGNKVRSPVKLKVRPKEALEETEGFEVRQASASPRKSFFNGKRKSQVDYLFEADGPTDIRIDVLKGKRRRLVDSIVKKDQEPFTTNSARWNGLTDENKVAPNGKYRFEVKQLSGGAGKRAKFRYYDHKFPVGGRHTYGDGLGAGRNHQGQDILAKCGKPIYAARGGRVQVRSYHSAAGYYLVIDGRKTKRDYAYMHLSKKGRVKEGQKVRTGQRIGWNDDTGNATACLLHFEMWSGPGWYEGGSPINPLKRLKRWDGWS